MNELPLPWQFLITGVVWLVIGIFVGALNRRDLAAGWKHAAKYWRYEALSRETLSEIALNSWIAVWKDHYNQSLRAEIKLREQLLLNGIEPDA